MKSVRCNRRLVHHVADDFARGVVLDDVLPAGVTIDAVDSVEVEILHDDDGIISGATTLAVANQQPNAAQFTDSDGQTVAIGRAILFDLAAGEADKDSRTVCLLTLICTLSTTDQLGVGVEVEVRK